MSEESGQAPLPKQPRVPAVSSQIAERDRHAARYIERLTGLLATGDLDGAERVLRRTSFSELVTNAAALHFALTNLESPVAMGQIASPDRPALLLAVAFARREAASDIDAFVPMLTAAGSALRRADGSAPADRARNLALASLCFLLAEQHAEAVEIGLRAADLIKEFSFVEESDEATLMGTAAADLALSLFLSDQVWPAAEMWQWVRKTSIDPRLPRLMQADWGISVVGLIIGNRTMVSSFAKDTIELPLAEGAENYSHVDPWWAIMASARAWARLDAGDAPGALNLTRVGVRAAGNSGAIISLSAAHVAALIACGRALSALEFLTENTPASESAPREEATNRAGLGMAAAALTGDAAMLAHFGRLTQGTPALNRVWSAFAALLGGDAKTAAALAAEPFTYDRSPRIRALYWTTFAATHARLGNEAVAIVGLRKLTSLAESHRTLSWLLLLPEEDLARLRDIATRASLTYALEILPEHTAVSAVQQVEFTPSEQEILTLVAQGFTNAQIATTLFISPNTVKFHVAKLLKRLGVSKREEAAAAMNAVVARTPVDPTAAR